MRTWILHPWVLHHVHCLSVPLYIPLSRGVRGQKPELGSRTWPPCTKKCLRHKTQISWEKSISNHSFAQVFHPVHAPPPSLQSTMRNPTVRQREERPLFSDLIPNSLFSRGFSSLRNSLWGHWIIVSEVPFGDNGKLLINGIKTLDAACHGKCWKPWTCTHRAHSNWAWTLAVCFSG